MRVVALVSGGKDSCFNMLQCVAAGHEIAALANLRPVGVDELDSYMYQTVGHDAIYLYSEAMELPLYREYIKGTSIQQGYNYEPTNNEDEVEDLYRLLSIIKDKENIEGVAVGAILSNYQRIRVENVCSRLGLTALCYLWQRDQEELLEEMIAGQIKAILIKVAALGLTPEKHLGKTIEDCQTEFSVLKKKFGLNVCGEGGEYETLTLDCPLFKKKIEIVESKVVYHSKDPFAPVAYLIFPQLHLISKDFSKLSENIKKPTDYCSEEIQQASLSSNIVHPDQSNSKILQFIPFSEPFSNTPKCNRTDAGTIFLSGFNAKSEDEFETLLKKFKDCLITHGSNLENVVSVSLYVRDMSEYSRLNTIYAKSFGLNPPVRACVQVPTALFIKLEAIAIDSERPKRNMHVQSISHWAPANIGPYSQCVQIGELFMVSGQIGLIPGSMTLPEPSNFSAECFLALRHTSRVLNVMDSELTLDSCIQAICYVRSETHVEAAKLIWRDRSSSSKCDLSIVVVSDLPRNALVEWQVIAHKDAGQVDELQLTTANKVIGAIRVNRHSDASAASGYLDELPTDLEGWNSFYYLITKALGPFCSLRVYYRAGQELKHTEESRTNAYNSLSVTFVPVCGMETNRAATVCGLCF